MAVATENGVEFEEIRYTKNPPDEATLCELIAKLEDRGIEILGREDDDQFGNFAWIVDPEGTKLELWQPPG